MFKLITFAILSFAMAQTCTDRKKSFDASSCTDTCTEDCEQRKNDYLLAGCCTDTTKAETKIIENFINLSPSTLNIGEWGANLIIEVLKKQKNVSITVGEYSSIRENFKNFTNIQIKSLVMEAYELIDSHQQSTITAEGNEACVNQTHIKVCCSKIGCKVVTNSSEVVTNSRRLSHSNYHHEDYDCYEKVLTGKDNEGYDLYGKLEADCTKCVQPDGENANIVHDIQTDLNNMTFNASKMSFKIGSFPPPKEYVVHDFVCDTTLKTVEGLDTCGKQVPHQEKFYWNYVGYYDGIPRTGYDSLNSFSKNKFDVGGIGYWEHVKFSPRPFNIQYCTEAKFKTVVRNDTVIKVNPAFFPVDGQVKYTGSGTGNFTLITQRFWQVSVKVIPAASSSGAVQWSSTPETNWGDAKDGNGTINYDQNQTFYDTTGDAMKYTFKLRKDDTLVFNNIPVFDFDDYKFDYGDDSNTVPTVYCGVNREWDFLINDCVCHAVTYHPSDDAWYCLACPDPKWNDNCTETTNEEYKRLSEKNKKRCDKWSECSDASLDRVVHIFAFLSTISAFLWLSPM